MAYLILLLLVLLAVALFLASRLGRKSESLKQTLGESATSKKQTEIALNPPSKKELEEILRDGKF